MNLMVKILADSENEHGDRLTTFELEYPYFIHAQMLTHRMLSRNAQSSRAFNANRLKKRVLDNPVIPNFRKEQAGMQPGPVLGSRDNKTCQYLWKKSLVQMLDIIDDLQGFGVHKQWVNRLLMPWQHIKAIYTGDDKAWNSFFTLRCAGDAQDEIRDLACAIRDAYDENKPTRLFTGEWHIPLLKEDDRGYDIENQIKLAVARCARVSYLTHDGHREPHKDIELYERLLIDGHMSPFEHVAQAAGDYDGSEPLCPGCVTRYNNFSGFKSWRYTLDQEERSKVQNLSNVTRIETPA